MPPKTIISRSDVLDAGIALTRAQGFESINARSLANALNCSAKPLFRLYKNMDELKQDVFQAVNALCSAALHAERTAVSPELRLAFNYVDFARSEPLLFKALFMNGAVTSDTIYNLLSEPEIEQLLHKTAKDQALTLSQAQSIVMKIWLMAHGIASLLAADGGVFEQCETETLLSEAFLELTDAAHRKTSA